VVTIRRYLGIIIKKARSEKGLSQKALIQDIGEYKVSLRTLRRIEQGNQNVKAELYVELLNYFGLKLFVLHDEYEHQIAKYWLFDNPYEDYSIEDCLYEIYGRIQEYRLFFGGFKKETTYHITNLAEFIIYLPLFEKSKLNDVLKRIGGSIHGRFYYILDQIEWLYEGIPDSKEKAAADKLAKLIIDDGDSIDADDYETYVKLLESVCNNKTYR